jgi:hypothetical protein
MLSEREQQALGEIERTISTTDPRLAALLRSSRAGQRLDWARLAHDLVIVVSVLSAVLCIVVAEVGAALIALLFAAVVLAVRWRRFVKTNEPNKPGR